MEKVCSTERTSDVLDLTDALVTLITAHPKEVILVEQSDGLQVVGYQLLECKLSDGSTAKKIRFLAEDMPEGNCGA